MNDLPDELSDTRWTARRRLALTLRRLRPEGTRQQQVSTQLGWRTPKLSQIELAMRVPTDDEVCDLLAAYHVAEDLWPAFLAVAEEARTAPGAARLGVASARSGRAPAGHARLRPSRCHHSTRGPQR